MAVDPKSKVLPSSVPNNAQGASDPNVVPSVPPQIAAVQAAASNPNPSFEDVAGTNPLAQYRVSPASNLTSSAIAPPAGAPTPPALTPMTSEQHADAMVSNLAAQKAAYDIRQGVDQNPGQASSGTINGPAYVNPNPGVAPNPNYGNEGRSVPKAKTNNYLPSLAGMLSSGEGSYFFGGTGKAAPAPAPTTVPLDPGVTPGLPQLAPQMSTPSTQPVQPVQPTQPVQDITSRPVPQGDATPPPGGGTITVGGRTLAIPPTGPTGIPAGGMVNPQGMINPQGNNMAATVQMQGELERARADNGYNNDLNQQSLANSQASVSAREDKEAKWEKEVADSSILNRVNSGDSPALMAAKTALAGQRNQAFDERAKNKGMMRRDDLHAKTESMKDATTRHGQNIQGEVAKAGNALAARGQDITAATSRDNNAATNATHKGVAELQAETSTKNTAGTNQAHLDAAKLHALLTGQLHDKDPISGVTKRTAKMVPDGKGGYTQIWEPAPGFDIYGNPVAPAKK